MPNDTLFPSSASGFVGSGRGVADTAARLALTLQQARGILVVEEETSLAWVLVSGGNPAVEADWLRVGSTADGGAVRFDVLQVLSPADVARGRANLMIDTAIASVVTVPDAAARKNAASYPGGVVPGLTMAVQADLPGLLWLLSGGDVTQDGSWLGLPYTQAANGEVVVDMRLGRLTGTVPEAGVWGVSGTVPTLGDGVTEDGRKLEVRARPDKMLRMVSVMPTGNLSGVVRTTTGYAVVMWWDGTTALLGNGSAASDIAFSKAVPGSGAGMRAMPKEIWIYPAMSQGYLSGDFTRIVVTNCNLTSIDMAGLEFVSYVSLGGNMLKTLDVSGMNALGTFLASDNPVTQIDVKGNAALFALTLTGGLMREVDMSGMTDLGQFFLSGCSNLERVTIGGMPSLSSFSLAACPNLNRVDVVGGFSGTVLAGYTSGYSLDFSGSGMTTDAVWDFLNQCSPSVETGYFRFVACSCDDTVTPGPALVEDGVRTQADVMVLLTAKNYALVLTGGILAP